MTLRKRAVLICVLLLGSTSVAQAQIERSRHFTDDFQYSALEVMVRINIYWEDKRSQGSGVCIGHDPERKHSAILTCAHVVEGVDKARGASVECFTKQHYPNPSLTWTNGFQLWVDRERDLALLWVPVYVPAAIKLCPSTTVVPFKTPVLAVGCGTGSPPVCQVGTFFGQDGIQDLVMNRGAIGGRSGGALISRHGLIGILARTGDDQTHAVNYWKIHQFLKKAGLTVSADGGPPAEETARRMLTEAVNTGVRFFNQGDHRGCYRVYHEALAQALPLLKGRQSLVDRIDEAQAEAANLASDTEKAWKLRKVIDVAVAALPTSQPAASRSKTTGTKPSRSSG
jgi:hypothetical protein